MNEPLDLDPGEHLDDTVGSVWKRRAILALLIVLLVALAAPTFGGCSGFLSQKKVVATFTVGGKTHDVYDTDLGEFRARYNATMRLFSDPRQQRSLPEGEEGEKSVLHVLMLDAAAQSEGVRAPDSVVVDMIQKHPLFQVNGKFDEAKYKETLAQWGGGALNHERLSDVLRVMLRTKQYEQMSRAAFDVIPGEDAYESWKKRSVKLTVDCVASPFEAQRAKVEAMTPDDKELEKLAVRPEVKKVLAIPPSKVVEVAYLKAADMSDAQFAAAKEFAQKAEIFDEDSARDDAAFILFHENHETAFTAAHWAAVFDPDYATRLAEHEKQVAAWEKLSKEEQAKQAKPGAAPKDPVADWPHDERSQFDKWKDRVERELLAREIVKHMAQRAEREGKALAEVAPDYAAFGVRVVRNPEPLPDELLVEKFPDAVARDSEFDQVARVQFHAPPAGTPFKRQYHADPVPTTRLGDRVQDRGFMVMALESCDPARSWSIADKREDVVKIWRKLQVAEESKKPLEEIKKAAEAAGTDVGKREQALKDAAAKAGLEVSTLRRFNSKTESPKAPEAPAGEKLPPDVAAVARRVAFRNYVQQGWATMSKKEPGDFVDPHWVNEEKMDAAMLLMVVEKHEPSPAEMQDDDVSMERMMVAQSMMKKANDLFGFDAVAKRFNLQRFAEKPKKEKAEAPAETPPKR